MSTFVYFCITYSLLIVADQPLVDEEVLGSIRKNHVDDERRACH